MEDKIKVLFATDFLHSSKMTLHFLAEMKKIYHADVYSMHVITSFWKDWLSSGIYEKEVLQRLHSWQQQVSSEDRDPEKLFIETGNVADSVLRVANKISVNLIILGGETPDIHGAVKTGASAESIVRSAKQPVWLCKSKQVKRVLCGVDGSDYSFRVLTEAIDVCKRFSAKLFVVAVLPSADFNPLGMEKTEIFKKEEEFKADKIRVINDFLAQFDYSAVEVERQCLWGNPARVILDLADDFDYDLVVVGARGESMFSHAIMGGTAERILRKVPCSLLVVR